MSTYCLDSVLPDKASFSNCHHLEKLSGSSRLWHKSLDMLIAYEACTVADLMDITALYACLCIDCSYALSEPLKDQLHRIRKLPLLLLLFNSFNTPIQYYALLVLLICTSPKFLHCFIKLLRYIHIYTMSGIFKNNYRTIGFAAFPFFYGF